MWKYKPFSIPIKVGEKLKTFDEIPKADAYAFRSLFGGLLYQTHTRPDLQFAVGMISHYMQMPSKYGIAMRILRYVSRTYEYTMGYIIKHQKKLCQRDIQIVTRQGRLKIGKAYMHMCFQLGQELCLGVLKTSGGGFNLY